ncbi:hypothetical protein GOP47_0021435 [Adiantum capillus-veneris]|uniref:Uncharacterized protein n=1 Tax=Adiantum capillus-veneris TaxID=13818 RepID=A0A9D4Z581_ADICA|nr:hypothetical protein GOP47_0021435 [Adiantum capillus-veneris]
MPLVKTESANKRRFNYGAWLWERHGGAVRHVASAHWTHKELEPARICPAVNAGAKKELEPTRNCPVVNAARGLSSPRPKFLAPSVHDKLACQLAYSMWPN